MSLDVKTLINYFLLFLQFALKANAVLALVNFDLIYSLVAQAMA